MNRDPESEAIAKALAEPFDPREVKWKPQAVKGNRCMAICYVDARLICDRLDEVMGVGNWSDKYSLLPDGSVKCRLRLRIAGEWITKEDVGSPSEQPDAGDRLKAAFSDALKRAAIKFGIGRYLYRLKSEWVDYDPLKKQIINPPQLPAWAIPGKQAPKPVPALPKDGIELVRRLKGYDENLTKANRIISGELVSHVIQAGIKAGYPANPSEWSGSAIEFAVDCVKDFEKGLAQVRS